MSPKTAAIALGKDGMFHQLVDGFMPRQMQQQMATAVADAITHGGALVAESGTGTGKTFAYLVPILLGDKRTIISTATKHLQDQIFHRDIPTVSKVLKRQVNAVMLKGRANYLCRYRLKLHSQQSDLIGKKSEQSFSIIERWAAQTTIGDISEVGEISEQSPIWQQVTSTPDNCLGNKCPDYKKCFVVRARQTAMEADVVVVNHHLFFSDLTLKEDGFGELLPVYDAVVFDEAHALGEIASLLFGFSVSSFQLKELCADIAMAEKEEASGADFGAVLAPFESAIAQLQRSLLRFEDQSIAITEVHDNQFQQAIEAVQIALDNLLQPLEVASTAGEGLEKCYQRACLLRQRIDEWSSGRDSNLVRWLRVGARFFRLHATPLRVDDRFGNVMTRAKSWIFTSATLAVGEDFSAFSDQLGLAQAQHQQWDSPYDFERNALLYMPTDMPAPSDWAYAKRLMQVITEVTAASKGRAFCLFTSYAMMNQVYKGLSKKFKWPMLLQGEAPRSELIDRFTRTDNSVLFGTSSFWQGVDIKGDGLSCVIIDKLPFASPGDPVLKSRLEACEQQGGNAFMDIQVPTAAIALKQGVGRLIRSESDRGVLVLCDPRITAKPYGNLFLKSLPEMPMSRQIYDVQSFFQHANTGD